MMLITKTSVEFPEIQHFTKHNKEVSNNSVIVVTNHTVTLCYNTDHYISKMM